MSTRPSGADESKHAAFSRGAPLLAPGITLYVVRHGQTDWNAIGRYQGHADTDLNDTGRAQARRNALALRGDCPDFPRLQFVASPLRRTRQTIEVMLSALGLDPAAYVTDDRLREIHYGHWEGQRAVDLPRTDPEGLEARRLDPVNWRPRGGETYVEMKARTDAWLSTVSRDTLVVTHGGPSRTLRGTLFGLDPPSVPLLEVPQDRVLVLTCRSMHWL